MTLYDLWKKAEKELPLHQKISEKYFGNEKFTLPAGMRERYRFEFSKLCPNLFPFVENSLKNPFTPRQLQAYLKDKTQKDWSLIVNIEKGAPESEILKARKYCSQKNYTRQDFSLVEEILNETDTLTISFECHIDSQTKIKLGLESILLSPEAPVNAFNTDETFNLYMWALGGPVTNGKNIWANCAKNENSEMLKSAIFEQMKNINYSPKNEETREK